VNRGSLFISLKPLSERGGLSAQAVANRLRQKTADIPGLRLYLFPMQVRVGGRLAADSAQIGRVFSVESVFASSSGTMACLAMPSPSAIALSLVMPRSLWGSAKTWMAGSGP
jgi:hypothetical protein